MYTAWIAAGAAVVTAIGVWAGTWLLGKPRVRIAGKTEAVWDYVAEDGKQTGVKLIIKIPLVNDGSEDSNINADFVAFHQTYDCEVGIIFDPLREARTG